MLKNQLVLITGSSSGIGAATASLAKQYGALPILHGRTPSKKLKELSKSLNCPYISCDVSDKKAVAKSIKSLVTKVGRIDALINSAGMALKESFFNGPDEDWIKTFKVNVLGTVHFCQETIPLMLKQKYGRIVNIASLRAHAATANNERMAYSVSKASIVNLTATLAKEFAPNILVNAVSPGYVVTPISKLWTKQGWKRATSNLLGRTLEAKEIAEVLLFLASKKNSAITGQTILVDGGHSIFNK